MAQPGTQNAVTQRFVCCLTELITSRQVSSIRQIALQLNYTPQGLHEIMSGKRNVPMTLLERAILQYGINVRQLFHGEGPMFEGNETGDGHKVLVVVTDQEQKERIVHVPVTAYAGYRQNLAEPVYVGALPTYSLPDNILRDGSYRSFDIGGDSMEPTLFPGDRVIGAFVEPQYWVQGIKDHLVYVLITQDDVVVKRVVNLIRTEKILELHSDNPAYPVIQLPAEELREAWIVRLKITSNLGKTPDHLLTSLQERVLEQQEMIVQLHQSVDALARGLRVG